MSKLPIPDSALSRHTAILGMTGSGKTTTGKLIVEHVVAEGSRVCVLDPLKSDWWGLTSSRDGKRAGLPFQILGGPHGHVPLHAGAGKPIGELVARGALPLSIIDMADFEAGGLQAFFVDFAAMLMKRMKGVLYLAVEEAHEFAPKERAGIGKENLALHYAKKLAVAGRSKGIRLLVLTQRTQSLHNAILGSCETMIVHRFTAPADQEPVTKWLKGNVKHKDLREKIEDGLSSLRDGQAWIVSGTAKILECVQFPRPKTYDNTKTPDDDNDERQVRTAAVNVEKLRSIIGDAVVEAEANDPKKLRAELQQRDQQIARLTHQLASKPTIDPLERTESMKKAEEYGYQRAVGQSHAAQRKVIEQLKRGIGAKVNDLGIIIARIFDDCVPVDPVRSPPERRIDGGAGGSPKLRVGDRVLSKVKGHEGVLQVTAVIGSNGEVPPSVRKILEAFHKSYPVSLSFDAAARRAGISSRSSSYNRIYRKAIAASPELEQDGDRYRSRPEFAQAGSVEPGASIDTWADRLPPAYAKMLRAIYEHGPIERVDVAQRAGVSPTSSGLGTGLKELTRLQLITKGEDGYQVADGLR